MEALANQNEVLNQFSSIDIKAAGTLEMPEGSRFSLLCDHNATTSGLADTFQSYGISIEEISVSSPLFQQFRLPLISPEIYTQKPSKLHCCLDLLSMPVLSSAHFLARICKDIIGR